MSTHGGSSQMFFKAYLPNFTENDMKLPISDKISGTPLPRKVAVESVSSGNIWRMVMMTTNSESDTVILRDGWKKIVKDENLTEPVLLVFEFDGSCIFHFCVYEHGSMCRRMRSRIEKEVTEVESEEESEETDENEDVDGEEADEDEESEETDEDENEDGEGDDDGNNDDVENREDDQESTEGPEESPTIKERGGTSRRRAYLKTDIHQFHQHLDNKMNPSFLVDITKDRTRIPPSLIKDYNLTFPDLVIVRDKIGTLNRSITVWKNKSVVLNGIGSITKRNHVKRGDTMVCELKIYGGRVREIKVHVIKG